MLSSTLISVHNRSKFPKFGTVKTSVIGITLIAIVLRLVFLGDRIAHWDEARVGYDILQYAVKGTWEFRPIVHGPFLPHVNRIVFEVLGASDFTSRLVVAVVGGLLPLSAWLYREHLRDIEIIALGLLLAADPILLYFSRFMRNDVLVATFTFAALGFYIRLLDTGKRRYLFAGTGLLALAFTTKENAVIYVLCVLGATLLLLDHRLYLVREGDPRWTSVAWHRLTQTGRALWRWRLPLLVAITEFFVILIVFYAPRQATNGGIGLWAAFAHPSMFPDVITAATYNPAPCKVSSPATPDPYCNGAWERVANLWLGGPHQDHAYLPFLGHYLWVLGSASGALTLLAIMGLGYDRYSGDRPRDLVALASYWGFVSILGYPIAMDIRAAWSVVHAIVPLSIPAAITIGMIVNWGREAYSDEDRVSVGLAAVVLLLLGGQIAGTAVAGVYVNPQNADNVLVQFAQPGGDFRAELNKIDRLSEGSAEPDVLLYGDWLVDGDAEAVREPACADWFNALPLPWYMAANDWSVECATNQSEFTRKLKKKPPVVISSANRTMLSLEFDGADPLKGYTAVTYEIRAAESPEPPKFTIHYKKSATTGS